MDLTLLIDGQIVSLPIVIALGLGVGTIAGMFGVGGGFVLVPALHVLLSISIPQAIGAALCQTIATSSGALLRYREMGHAEVRFDVMALGGSLIGVDAGTRLLALLAKQSAIAVGGYWVSPVQLVVTVIYALLFVVIAALLIFRSVPSHAGASKGILARIRWRPTADYPTAGLRNASGPIVGLVGLVNGMLAGLIGIGGGIFLVPILLYGFGFDMRKAAGTGILIVLAVSVLGTIQHARLGNVHLGLAVPLMLGSAIAAQFGATLTRSLGPVVLRRALAVVLLVAVAALLLKL